MFALRIKCKLTTSFLLLLVRHGPMRLLVLVANIVTTSKALVTSSVALVPTSSECLGVPYN